MAIYFRGVMASVLQNFSTPLLTHRAVPKKPSSRSSQHSMLGHGGQLYPHNCAQSNHLSHARHSSAGGGANPSLSHPHNTPGCCLISLFPQLCFWIDPERHVSKGRVEGMVLLRDTAVVSHGDRQEPDNTSIEVQGFLFIFRLPMSHATDCRADASPPGW